MTATADVCAQQASSDSGLEEVLVTTKRGNETIRTIINPPDLTGYHADVVARVSDTDHGGGRRTRSLAARPDDPVAAH
jgi:hypothetical protein